jgi:lipoate-protein ligase A
MYLFDLGKLPGQQSMLVFHVLARMGIEGLVIVSPKNPLASIGYFQDAAMEIDLSFCRENGIPFMRREVGGGATYLDENQIFYQLIWKRSNAQFPGEMRRIFGEFSIPACETYRKFGIEASFRQENDIVTREGKKIAGEGGGDIGDCMVFVGGILLDFDYEAMSRILKVPDEKFRDKVYKSIEKNLTTMKRERFLFKRTPKIPRGIRIKGGLEIRYGLHKAKGGLIRTVEELEKNKIREIELSGDFQFYPKDDLSTMEVELRKTEFEEGEVRNKIQRFYEEHRIQAPGVLPEDFTTAIVKSQSEGSK